MSKNKDKSTNPIKLRSGLSVGTGNAETEEELLEECFVNTHFIDQFIDLSSSKMIVDGRTGAGKTAIIKMINSREPRASEVDPTEISISYVSNSDVLSFLSAIDADLDLLFQILWKHIIIIEYIRLKWNVKDEMKSRNTFQRISEIIFRNRDERKKKAIDYLETWQGSFWITMDENIKEITKHYERNIEAEVGGEIKKFKAGGQYQKRMGEGHKEELRQRVRKIIDTDLLIQLSSVIDALSDISRDNSNLTAHYILIDRLDEKWVDDKVKFVLINSLSESLKGFRKIRDLKVIVALRSDVRERCLQEIHSSTFQREKIDDYVFRLKWSKQLLKNMIDERIKYLFKRQYSQSDIGFDVLFDAKIGAKKTIDWILERTLMRPRDVIMFVNETLENSDGHYDISATVLKNSERSYSQKRRDALFQEWYSAFPTLKVVASILVRDGSPRRTFKQLLESEITDEIALEIYSENKIFNDPLFESAKKFADGKVGKEIWAKEILSLGYRTSLLGIKTQAHEPYQYSHLHSPILDTSALKNDSKIMMHPMLLAAYGLHEAAQ